LVLFLLSVKFRLFVSKSTTLFEAIILYVICLTIGFSSTEPIETPTRATVQFVAIVTNLQVIENTQSISNSIYGGGNSKEKNKFLANTLSEYTDITGNGNSNVIDYVIYSIAE